MCADFGHLRSAAAVVAAALLLVAAGGARGQDVYTDNVVIVLDASGSMSQAMTDAQGRKVRKMDAAKAALLQVIGQTPPTTHIGLLVFSANNISDPWVYPLGPRDDAKLKAAVAAPQPGDGTPLGTYMKMGADRLLQARAQQRGYGSYRLLVVTDGEANEEPADLVEKCTLETIARGITVDVIGVAMASRHTLATKVHSYRGANDPQALMKAVHEVFAEVGGTRGGHDAAGAEAFQDLAGIPDGVAAGMLRALAKMPNHPIGEKPPAPPPEGGTAVAEAPAPAPAADGGGSRFVMWALIIVLVVAFLFVRAAIRSARQGRGN